MSLPLRQFQKSHEKSRNKRSEVFSTTTIYTCNSVNLAVAVGPSTLLLVLQEAGFRSYRT